jgi:hypothetical protein
MPYSQAFLRFDDSEPTVWVCFEFDGETTKLYSTPYPAEEDVFWSPEVLPERTPLFAYECAEGPCAFWYENSKLYKCSMTPIKTIGGISECFLNSQGVVGWKLLPLRTTRNFKFSFPESWHKRWNEEKKSFSTLFPENITTPDTPFSLLSSLMTSETSFEKVFNKLLKAMPQLPLSTGEHYKFKAVIAYDWDTVMQDKSEEEQQVICQQILTGNFDRDDLDNNGLSFLRNTYLSTYNIAEIFRKREETEELYVDEIFYTFMYLLAVGAHEDLSELQWPDIPHVKCKVYVQEGRPLIYGGLDESSSELFVMIVSNEEPNFENASIESLRAFSKKLYVLLYHARGSDLEFLSHDLLAALGQTWKQCVQERFSQLMSVLAKPLIFTPLEEKQPLEYLPFLQSLEPDLRTGLSYLEDNLLQPLIMHLPESDYISFIHLPDIIEEQYFLCSIVMQTIYEENRHAFFAFIRDLDTDFLEDAIGYDQLIELLEALPQENQTTLMTILGIDFIKNIITDGSQLINVLRSLHQQNRLTFIHELSSDFLKRVIKCGYELAVVLNLLSEANQSALIDDLGGMVFLKKLVTNDYDLREVLYALTPKNQLIFVRNLDADVFKTMIQNDDQLSAVLQALKTESLSELINGLDVNFLKDIITDGWHLRKILNDLAIENHAILIHALSADFFKTMIKNDNQLLNMLEALAKEDRSVLIRALGAHFLKTIITCGDQFEVVLNRLPEGSAQALMDTLGTDFLKTIITGGYLLGLVLEALPEKNRPVLIHALGADFLKTAIGSGEQLRFVLGVVLSQETYHSIMDVLGPQHLIIIFSGLENDELVALWLSMSIQMRQEILHSPALPLEQKIVLENTKIELNKIKDYKQKLHEEFMKEPPQLKKNEGNGHKF